MKISLDSFYTTDGDCLPPEASTKTFEIGLGDASTVKCYANRGQFIVKSIGNLMLNVDKEMTKCLKDTNEPQF